ncbi:MAG TPA: ABC transporter substrate-binding protein [Kineosporiaceae bacterium]
MFPPGRFVGAALAAIVVFAVGGCASAGSVAAGRATGAASTACVKDQLRVKTAGKLTVGTDNPVYEPWFVDNKPGNGKGFESAVAYAVARQLGFADTDVVWTTANFNAAIAPGPKTFDVDINEVSITADRAKVIDFSRGYYDVAQAVVTVKGSRIAGARSIADLKNATLGAQVGTTSYTTITDVIRPAARPAVFNSNDDAKAALSNGQIDGLVLDLPTALYEAKADLKQGVLVGQFRRTVGVPEQFGLVLDKDSPLTSCVSRAVDALRSAGTLGHLEQQWLTSAVGAPILA